MKRKMTVSLAVALAVIMMLGCAGFAATQLDGIAGMFGYTDSQTGEIVVNEAVIAGIESLNETYEGEKVRFTLTEALYSPESKIVVLGWTLEPIDEDAEYYVLCDVYVDGIQPDVSGMVNVSEYFLREPVKNVFNGRLRGETTEMELKFSIMKVNGEIVPYDYSNEPGEDLTPEEWIRGLDEYLKDCYAAGKLPLAGDGMIETPYGEKGMEESYAEQLVNTGLVELAEEFTVTFDLGTVKPAEEKRVYEGEKEFVFDGFEIRVNECVVTPMASQLVIDYISDTAITEENWEYLLGDPSLTVEGEETWAKNISATLADPVQTEDGRWKVTITCRANSQTIYPEELIFSLTRYGENDEPIPMTGDGIRLKLTDR